MSLDCNGSGSSRYPKSMRKLTRSGFERLLEEMKQLCFPDETDLRPNRDKTECLTVWARGLGIDVNHISSNNIEVQVKCGIAYSHFDGGGRVKRIIFVNLNLRFPDIVKKIESRCDLAPGTFRLEFESVGVWCRLSSDKDWRCCLRGHVGKEYIIVRCLMETPSIDMGHLKPEDYQIRVEYGIAYSDDDGDGNDKGVVYVHYLASVADFKEAIEAQSNVAPGTYILQYYYERCWKMLLDSMELCFDLHLCIGNQYVTVRCLMEGPGNQAPCIKLN